MILELVEHQVLVALSLIDGLLLALFVKGPLNEGLNSLMAQLGRSKRNVYQIIQISIFYELDDLLGILLFFFVRRILDAVSLGARILRIVA